jgi:TatA/E family protein of Tat protein translocase
MFGSVGFPELMLIFVIALLLFGPRKLPEIGRSIGRALGEFRRASNDLKRTIEEEVASEDLRQVGREVRDAATLTPVAPPSSQPPAPARSDAPAPPPFDAAGTAAPEARPDVKVEPK